VRFHALVFFIGSVNISATVAGHEIGVDAADVVTGEAAEAG